MAESFFATLECELIRGHPFRDIAEARFSVLDYIEGFYNPQRRHSALGYLSPADYNASTSTHHWKLSIETGQHHRSPHAPQSPVDCAFLGETPIA